MLTMKRAKELGESIVKEYFDLFKEPSHRGANFTWSWFRHYMINKVKLQISMGRGSKRAEKVALAAAEAELSKVLKDIPEEEMNLSEEQAKDLAKAVIKSWVTRKFIPYLKKDLEKTIAESGDISGKATKAAFKVLEEWLEEHEGPGYSRIKDLA